MMETMKNRVLSFQTFYTYFTNFMTNIHRIDEVYDNKIKMLKKSYTTKRQRLKKRMALRRKHRQTIMRRRRVLFLFLILQNCTKTVNRRIWKLPRDSDLWKDVHLWTDAEWVKNVRMSKNTFDYICRELSPELEKQRSKFR